MCFFGNQGSPSSSASPHINVSSYEYMNSPDASVPMGYLQKSKSSAHLQRSFTPCLMYSAAAASPTIPKLPLELQPPNEQSGSRYIEPSHDMQVQTCWSGRIGIVRKAAATSKTET